MTFDEACDKLMMHKDMRSEFDCGLRVGAAYINGAIPREELMPIEWLFRNHWRKARHSMTTPNSTTSETSHRERCEREGTLDVIFLLQVRTDVDGWRTETVWLDRDEAESYARLHGYNFGKKDRDWRVYGACAYGDLAELLKRQDTPPDPAPDAPALGEGK